MSDSVTAGGLVFWFENRRSGDDGGPSLQVLDRSGARPMQLLRFDMFEHQPHYHYAPNGKDLRYNLDPLTVDDGIGWAIALLRDRLPLLLDKAGRETAMAPEDVSAVRQALPDIETRWRAQEPVGMTSR